MGGFIYLDWFVYMLYTKVASDVSKQVSDGGVHSHITHLYALLETAKELGVPECYIHFFGDGRDTAPRSAKKYCEELIEFTKKLEYGEIATVVGRYYAMDRDKRWERVKIAVDGLVQGVGQETDNVLELIDEKYKEDQTDEFLKPIICGGPKSRIQGVLKVGKQICNSDKGFALKMTIPCFFLTIARTACVRLSASLD